MNCSSKGLQMTILAMNRRTKTICGESRGIQPSRIEAMLNSEWLLTNRRAGFASGTAAGCNTRRYHGLLVGSLNPPANRIMALSACFETVKDHTGEYSISRFEFPGEPLQDEDMWHLAGIRKDIGVHFDYCLQHCRLTKSIYLASDVDVAAIVYDFGQVEREFEFEVRPLVAMRDFHSLQKSTALLNCQWHQEGLIITGNYGLGEMFILAEQMGWKDDPQWWYNFEYRVDRLRGQDYQEDLWSPGFYHCWIDGAKKIVLWASFAQQKSVAQAAGLDIDVVRDDLLLRRNSVLKSLKSRDGISQNMALAGDNFLIERKIHHSNYNSIIAGFPWFGDWGRDTFISLPGLLLYTGRFKQAMSVLRGWTEAIDEGMIPNFFDDYGGNCAYNSIDATLWYIHAAFEYLRLSGDKQGFSSELMPVIRWMVNSYNNGTKYCIRADEDLLITGGDEQTQLTWMDAKFGDVVFTPRFGKPVEVNALWYSILKRIAEFYEERDTARSHSFAHRAAIVAENFRNLFWNREIGCLYDCIRPDGTKDPAVRPNQIFAVSLADDLLTDEQKRGVMEIVQKELLTPYGLRTLSPRDPRYIGQYEGTQAQRDAAYHQGTAWPWLMGHFVEAYLRTYGTNNKTKNVCRDFIQPLIEPFQKEDYIGSIAEIYDGSEPQRPKGAFAQAWSVAELLRAYVMVNS